MSSPKSSLIVVFSETLSSGLSIFKNITFGISGSNRQLILSSVIISPRLPIADTEYLPSSEVVSIKSKKYLPSVKVR